MKRVHVLTAGFTTSNGQAFLMPLILHRRALRDAGLEVRLFRHPSPGLTDCDVLMLDGKYFGPRWEGDTPAVLEEVAGYRARIDNLIYVDLADSASWDHSRALPHVKLYCKSQLLRDRTAYLKPLYGYRAFTDYYHRECGVNDDPPVVSEPVNDPSLLDKLAVGWNSALADYSEWGVYRMQLYDRLPLRPLLRFPKEFTSPAAERSNPVSCRVGTRYVRATISHQRTHLLSLLKDRVPPGRVPRKAYFAELRNTRVALSPFGYGEVCYRDFEIFLSGALMLKPDMSGIETWPDLYRGGETMVAHRWDLTDIIDRLDELLAHPGRATEIAERGQAAYRRHLCGDEAGPLFAEHLNSIVAKAQAPAATQQSPARAMASAV
jgi:hypothetical protein